MSPEPSPCHFSSPVGTSNLWIYHSVTHERLPPTHTPNPTQTPYTPHTQRASPNLLVDINLEALFAAGVVQPPAPPQPPRDRTASAVEFLEHVAAPPGLPGAPVGGGAGGGLSAHGLLHLIQSTYCKFEALRMSVSHSNGELLSLLGCSSAADYEALLGTYGGQGAVGVGRDGWCGSEMGGRCSC